MTTRTSDPPRQARTTLLSIDGMTCGGCVRHVHNALTSLDGVLSADLDLPGRQARVVHDPAVGVDDLVAAVTGAGYDATAR